jgi:glycerate kinase
MVMEAVRLDDRLKGAQLVITGEGRLDSQTARFGKGPAAVARHARNAGIPVVAIAGGLADETELHLLFDGLKATVVEPVSLDQAIAQASPLLVRAATRVMRLVLTGRRLAERPATD